MLEEDIMAEIRSVFSEAMGFDSEFPFTFSAMKWPRHQLTDCAPVVFLDMRRMAGQGCLYIKAERGVVIPKQEKLVEAIFKNLLLSTTSLLH